MSQEWIKYAFRSKHYNSGKSQDSREDLEDQG